MDKERMRTIAQKVATPFFVFDTDCFASCAAEIKTALGDIPLCFSIKANPFLLAALPDCISKVEVCSPGELAICKTLRVDPAKIIYSGVNKGLEDILEAIDYGADILTAESLRHVSLIRQAAAQRGVRARVILRLSNGNQFGMDEKDIEQILSAQSAHTDLEILGFHYYTGTQKKKTKIIDRDVETFRDFIRRMEETYGFHPTHVEYGPGLAAEYFEPPFEEKDRELLSHTAQLLREFAAEYPLTVEMGRFLASACGTYFTHVADLKETDGMHYVICDGGINHLKYYGQTMAMQVPPICVLNDSAQTQNYTLCGSLCTTADLLVRSVELPVLEVGDVLVFGRCGAYTVTEGVGLFLSRTLPQIALLSARDGLRIVRGVVESHPLNTPQSCQ